MELGFYGSILFSYFYVRSFLPLKRMTYNEGRRLDRDCLAGIVCVCACFSCTPCPWKPVICPVTIVVCVCVCVCVNGE